MAIRPNFSTKISSATSGAGFQWNCPLRGTSHQTSYISPVKCDRSSTAPIAKKFGPRCGPMPNAPCAMPHAHSPFPIPVLK
ncbi:MAG: hypothetical protein F6J93_37120 [Oscillatoria sp. SIO1A7]|nr:hypothetical protein [Oscillatoria sp. SIO1A7]